MIPFTLNTAAFRASVGDLAWIDTDEEATLLTLVELATDCGALTHPAYELACYPAGGECDMAVILAVREHAIQLDPPHAMAHAIRQLATVSIDTSRFLGRQAPQSHDDLARILQRMLEIADALAERLDLLRVAETQASRSPGVRSAEQALPDLHRYLFPERYADVPTYSWHAGTIEDVAALVEAALPGAPRATGTPVS